jgi:hypothetical protein
MRAVGKSAIQPAPDGPACLANPGRHKQIEEFTLMTKFTKKAAVGIATTAAATALVAGIAAPAMAATAHETATKVSTPSSSASTGSTLTQTQLDSLRTLVPGALGNGTLGTGRLGNGTVGSLPVSVSVGLNVGGVGHGNTFGLGDGIPLVPGNLTSAATSGAGPATTAAKSAGSAVQNLLGSATNGSGLGSSSSNVTGVLGGILGDLGIG